jgi:hypothetical protein
MSETKSYDEEFDKDTEENKLSPEESLKLEALNELATTCRTYVEESTVARNTSKFAEEIKRSYQLYNATALDNVEDLMDDFEGTRKAVEDGSKVVINIIRQITNDGASQLGDMLFPTDEDNYGIDPVYPSKPPLAIRNEEAVNSEGQPLVPAETTQDPETGEEVAGDITTNMMAWEARKVALNARVERMFTKIDGTMERIQFGKIGRRCIEQAAQTGTGIIKGPGLDPKSSRQWAKNNDGNWDLNDDLKHQSTYTNVNVLDFLPDMSAESVDDAAYISVREWKLKRQVLGLVGLNYYDDQIGRLLTYSPKEISSPDQDQERYYIKDQSIAQDNYDKRYEIFETWSDFDRELLENAGVNIPERFAKRPSLLTCVIHCNGITLKAYVAPQQDEMPFSVWCWDENPLSIFGHGIPALAENLQLIYHAAWRMILDHGGVAAVPQIVMMKGKLKPANGDPNDFTVRGGRIWEYVGEQFNIPDGSNAKPFEIFEIPMALDQLFAILDKAEEDAYKCTGVTRVEKTQAGIDNAPITLGATQIFQNNASVSRRRQVRNFDDEIIKSIMTREYNWHMMYDKDDDIKGAMIIEPKGSSVLMQREVNTQNLMMLLQVTGNGALAGSKPEAMLRRIEAGMQMPSGSVVETVEETEARNKLEAENPPIDPAVQVEQVKLKIEETKVANKAEEIEAKFELEQARLRLDTEVEEAKIQLKMIADERTHVREMLRLELMDKAAANKAFASLQSDQANVSVKLQEIQSKRDMKVGDILDKQEVNSANAQSAMLSATARERDSQTKQRELDNKLAGNIKQGV